ncbi:hypothetical protein [Clostridium saccharobutylicum]|uniref:YqzN/YkzM domain-containing protein n=1 Tax=Clostridium saccharobutylicum DSM 13864 TaxID=1345695 RepID=U5MYG6_CLOSA|nr:hypothetical protein [Clostridium saccharobutylicum]AGX44512.1 hypothetical protein CLSA_c35510 [Clostridium saccharobutylicum DSM 13864]AQR91805.1 hypothetical protein CLOSC_35330 [Clostridium saccharobutylicum]AQS01707.1 hypothetical protein CSACC_35380 [Clostridium saccharobutylicum]AQS15690.1 hypothetical protein CLOSACC_35380 [Clostridium saccharobutylicum]MBA2907467.1 FtsZ-interacting cell division protein ZipA [Clostridium saccharobutylicum]
MEDNKEKMQEDIGLVDTSVETQNHKLQDENLEDKGGNAEEKATEQTSVKQDKAVEETHVENDDTTVVKDSSDEKENIQDASKKQENDERTSIKQEDNAGETAIKRDNTQIEQKNEEIKEKEEEYLVQDLIENCKALGYRKEVAAGALFNCEKKEMTKTEFKDIIKKFLEKRVK